jgi:hypothetical protein
MCCNNRAIIKNIKTKTMNKLKFLFLSVILLSSTLSLMAQQKKWTYMVYLFGSDLEGGFKDGAYGNAGTNDIEEMLQAGSTDNVNVIVTTGGTDKDGWREIKRWKIENGQQIPIDFNAPNDRMADPRNLTDFINWAVANYPADNYVLDLWNHGADIQGYGGDELPQNHHEIFKIPQLKQAIQGSNFVSQGNKFEILGFDACLMANLEVHNAMKTFANYIVSSEQLEPGHGWDYRPIIQSMESGSVDNGVALGRVIADGFLAQANSQNTNQVTLSVVEAAKIDPLIASIEGLFNAIGNDGTADLQNARARSEDYASTSTGEDAGNNHDVVDIGHLAENLKDLNGKYANAANGVLNALNEAVKYTVKDREQPNSTGLSLFVPHKLFGKEYGVDDVFNKYYNDLNFSSNIKGFIKQYAQAAQNNENGAPEGESADPDEEYDDWEEGGFRGMPVAKDRNSGDKQIARAIVNDPSDLETVRVLLIETNALEDENDFLTLGAVLPDRLRYAKDGRLLIEYDWDQEWLGIGGYPVNIQNVKQTGLGGERGSIFGPGGSTAGQLSTRGSDVMLTLTIPAVINPDEDFFGRDVYLNYVQKPEGGYRLISIIPQREEGKPNNGQKERVQLKTGDKVMLLYDGFNEKTDELFDAVDPEAVFTIQNGNSDLDLDPILLPLGAEFRIAFELIDFSQKNTIVYDSRNFVSSEIMLGNVVANGGATDLTICTGDGEDDILTFGLEDCNMDNITYVLTTGEDFILGAISNKIQFEGAPVYDFRVYALAYYGDLTVNYGDNIKTAALASSDFTLSPNYVAISVIGDCTKLQEKVATESFININPYKYTEGKKQVLGARSKELTNVTDLIKGKQIALQPNSTKAYPNPTTNRINIDIARYSGKQATIAIINTLGQNMQTMQVEKVGAEPLTMELQSLKAGVYIIQVNINGLLMDSHKLIKQ